MVLTIADWKFRVDPDSTTARTISYSTDHCLCAYCRNYYDTVKDSYPMVCRVLGKFGIAMEGPCEVMPLEPNVILSCYRVTGEILQKGNTRIHVDEVGIFPEAEKDGTFLLWVGALFLPWVQSEPMEDVISPANQPEFLERMTRKWLELTEEDLIMS